MKYWKTQTLLSVILMLLCLSYLSNQDTKIKEEDLVKQWKPRDFYLIYQMWTDKDLIELRKQIEEDSKVHP